MSRAPSLRRSVAVLTGTAALSAGLIGPAPVFATPNHQGVPAAAPATATPDIKEGYVDAIWDAGAKVIAGGTFLTVENRGSDAPIRRNYVLAFNKATGAVDTAFAPVVDGDVTAVLAGPTPGTVLIAGSFNTVNGVTRRKIAVLNVGDGSVVASWKPPAINSKVNDVVRSGGNYLLGGPFTVVGAQDRRGLASLNAADGGLNTFLTVGVDTNHNWTGPGSGARSPVGPDKLAISPDGRQLVVIGNFKNAGGTLHDQVVKLDLGATATIANWNTAQFTPECARHAFDSWVRDVGFAPDSSYFVIVTTGAPKGTTLCDTASAWEANATGTNLTPRWVNWSGGDTFLSVTVTEKAVYVGGHFRWLNNPGGTDSATPGAVGRASIAALDPANGLPLAWNPGRRPRGYGVTELYATAEGLWVGHDTEWFGNYQHRRERIAFLPMAGGHTPHATNVAALPGRVYQAGNVIGAGVNDVSYRTYAGTGTASTRVAVANPDGTPWSSVRGAFWVGGTLFYAMGGTLYRRTFDGTTLGAASVVNPYSDAYWDTVPTDSSTTTQTFKGLPPTFYAELPNVTGMFYSAGRVYYTLNGQSSLFYRYFTPDSGVVGATRFVATGSALFADSGGVFLSGNTLYLVSRTNGRLSAGAWSGSGPAGALTVTETQDWRGCAVFVAP